MGGPGSGRKVDPLKNFMAQRTNVVDVGGVPLELPNHSGDHSAGITATPINPSDLVNKEYVDDLVNKDFFLEVAKGNVDGTVHVNKFGRAPSGIQTTPTDIWDRATAAPLQSVWIAPTQARVHAIVSDDIDDSDSGGVNPQSTGARTIRVSGLTSWSAAEVSEDIILDGTTAVNTINSYVIIHRMRVLTAGSSGINEGAISATAATDATVTAQINDGEGQTQMAIYGIPSTQIAYVTQFYGTLNKSAGAASTVNLSLVVNEDPVTDLDLFIIKNTHGLQSTGMSVHDHPFMPYFKVAGPAIIKVRGQASVNDIEASGGFDLFLVDN